jgi:DNA-binding response OmpR family regulator
MNAEAGAPAGSTVVVADDDVLFSTRIAAALAALGYAPVVVRSGDAFTRALGRRPAAAIINLAARRFDGVALIRDAKGDAATRAVPLLSFCGHRDLARRTAAHQAGCDLVTTNGAIGADLPRLLRSLIGATDAPAARGPA